MTSASGVLLAHGAGGGADHRVLVMLERCLGLPVHRMEFPYRREGRKMPDRAPKLIAAVRSEAEGFAARLGVRTGSLVLGGRSLGGRMCSMAVAEGLPAAGLLLLSYPLHPPGKQDKMRSGHFHALDVPVLFVNGDRDPFGSPDELTVEASAIPGPVTFAWLKGQRHDPDPTADDEIAAAGQAFVAAL